MRVRVLVSLIAVGLAVVLVVTGCGGAGTQQGGKACRDQETRIHESEYAGAAAAAGRRVGAIVSNHSPIGNRGFVGAASAYSCPGRDFVDESSRGST